MKPAALAKKLREARKESGLTQKELGGKIGTTRQFITRIESGTQNLTLETLQTVAGALNYDLTIELKQKKKANR
jgi:UDP-N-acetylglucosamine 1-carboxyvinyltransferase